MSESVCYKIRDSETGLWSSGGTSPRFTKSGKAWACRGHLLNHLAQHQANESYYTKAKHIPRSWEVVTFRVTVHSEQGDVVNARDLYEKHKDSK